MEVSGQIRARGKCIRFPLDRKLSRPHNLHGRNGEEHTEFWWGTSWKLVIWKAEEMGG